MGECEASGDREERLERLSGRWDVAGRVAWASGVVAGYPCGSSAGGDKSEGGMECCEDSGFVTVEFERRSGSTVCRDS
jgi:hypothetical protein